MRLKNLFILLTMILAAGSLTQCEKGPGGGMLPPDSDSDRPDWAGGNTVENPHNKQGDGGTNGGNTVDYGDLYVVLRDANGLPKMKSIDVYEDGEFLETIWVVQPVDVNYVPLELDGEGGVIDTLSLIPVDFGRLNIVRSPQSVLDQALREALKVINVGEAFTYDFCGRLTIWNTVDGILTITKTIDSPRESMALYQEIMNNGFTGQLNKLNGSGIKPFTLAASCFAAGSDKTGTVNIDEVVYINGFMGCLGGDCYLENEYEYDKYHDYDWKRYFNYGDCECHSEFQYNRKATYEDRWLRILLLDDETGMFTYDTISVLDVMEGAGLFNYKWGDPSDIEAPEIDEDEFLNLVNGFAAAIDDAVQVLNFVHGDSNIEFLPGYSPE